MAKKNAIVSTSIDALVLTVNVEGFDPIVIDAAKLSEDIRNAAMMHGLKQKIVDAAALPKDDAGNAATPGDKHSAMVSVAAQIAEGDWNKRGEGTGDSAPSGIIFLAYAEVMRTLAAKKKIDVPADERLREMYDAKDRKAQLALRTNPDIASAMERIKAERGAGKSAKVNSDDLLAELG